MARIEQPPRRVAYCNYDWAACEHCEHALPEATGGCAFSWPELALDDTDYVICLSFTEKQEKR